MREAKGEPLVWEVQFKVKTQWLSPQIEGSPLVSLLLGSLSNYPARARNPFCGKYGFAF